MTAARLSGRVAGGSASPGLSFLGRRDSFVISQLVDDLSYHADLTGGQSGNEPAFMPAYEAARSRSTRNRPRFDIMVSEHD
jgi:hypothetical protein